MNILGFLLNNWVWVIAILGIIGSYIVFGKTGFMIALGVVLSAFGYSKGSENEKNKQKAKNIKDTKTISKIRTETQSKSDEEIDKELQKWTRKS